VGRGVLAAAEPAEIVFASSASHVVASGNLLHSDFAPGTQLNLFSFGPFFILLLFVNSALNFAMEVPPTFRAQLNRAFWAFVLISRGLGGGLANDNDLRAVNSRTKLLVWVLIDQGLVFKPQIPRVLVNGHHGFYNGV
jgi:hypothetical protein